MGKKKGMDIMSLIYLLGMAVVAIGFCCPMFKGLGQTPSGFKFIDFDNGGFTTVGALLIFIGACAGVAVDVLNKLGILKGNMKLIKLIALVASIAGGIVLIVGFNDNKIYKFIAKGFLKHAYVGFYMVLVGWVVSIVGFLTSKK